MAILAAAACADNSEKALKEKVESYAVVEVSSPLYDALSENDKKIVGLFRQAGEIMDGLFWKQTFGDKAEIEAPYHALTGGGHIFYVEIDGDATHNPEAIMNIVDLMDKYDIGYCSVNHNRNRCMDCGFENAKAGLKKCPHCGGEHIDQLQRITGYLVGTTSRWN